MTQTSPFQGFFAAIPVSVLFGLAVASASPSPDSSRVEGFRSRFQGHAFLGLGTVSPDHEPYFNGPHAGGWAAWTPEFPGMEARLSLGGNYIRPSPRSNDAASANNYIRYYEGGPDEVWLRGFFHPFSWSGWAQAGMFRWRENPDARLSGGYLSRWGSNSINSQRVGQEWDALDSLTVLVTGLRIAFVSPRGAFTHQAIILKDDMEFRTDFTPVYSITASPLRGVDFGATAAFYRLIPFDGPETQEYYIPVNDSFALDTATVSWSANSFSVRIGLDLASLLRGQPVTGRADRAGRIYSEAALLGRRTPSPFIGKQAPNLHLMAGAHLPSFGLLEDFRLQVERTPKVGAFYDEDGQPGFRPSYQLDGVADHLWLGQLSLAKEFRSWLGFQAWLLTELGSEGGHPPSDNINVYVRKGVFLFGTRLVARF